MVTLAMGINLFKWDILSHIKFVLGPNNVSRETEDVSWNSWSLDNTQTNKMHLQEGIFTCSIIPYTFP